MRHRKMVTRAPSSKVKEVFENLLVMEEHEQLELSKTMQEVGLDSFRSMYEKSD